MNNPEKLAKNGTQDKKKTKKNNKQAKTKAQHNMWWTLLYKNKQK